MVNPIRIHTYDIAHGNCHAIWSPSGKLIVIDLGTSDDFSPITWLKSKGHNAIDYLILTHPHDDHIRGFRDLVNMQVKILHRPKNIPAELMAELDHDLKTHWSNFDSGYSRSIEPHEMFYHSGSPAFDGLSIEIFGGVSDSSNLNNYSLVIVARYHDLKIIFPGDLEDAGWRVLLEKPEFVAAIKGAQILVAPHHGRAAGWCAELFDHIMPQLVIISDGSETDTSIASSYHQKSAGARVRATNTNDIRTRYVLSTRDNGHIDIRASMNAAGTGSQYEVDIQRH